MLESLSRSIETAKEAGISNDAIVVDRFGFGKPRRTRPDGIKKVGGI
jgi:hypothetical protein